MLVDLKMPVMDGFELLERLRAEHDLEARRRRADHIGPAGGPRGAHDLGAHAYVTKEASFPQYRDLLEGLLADVARS